MAANYVKKVKREGGTGTVATARDLKTRLDARDPLFNQIGWDRLRLYADLNLPGIVDLPASDRFQGGHSLR